jgi:quercetin dioxygenase-like cupin family protein
VGAERAGPAATHRDDWRRIIRGGASAPRTYWEDRTMSNEQVSPEPRGVTVEVLATVDLAGEIEGMAGRQLRMRMVTIEPGGVFGPIHDHKGRPGTVYVLQGTITDHRNGIATDYGPGVGWPEDRNTTHWLENRGPAPAVEISVDIVGKE